MKDDNADVRLGVAKSLFDIFVSSDQNILTTVPAIFGTLQKDNQYKIREKVIHTQARLGVIHGLEIFKQHYEAFFFNYLTDSVSSVRETGVTCLDVC